MTVTIMNAQTTDLTQIMVIENAGFSVAEAASGASV